MVKRSSVEERAQAAAALAANEEQKPEIVGEFLTEVSRLITSGDSAVVCNANWYFYQKKLSMSNKNFLYLGLKRIVTKSRLHF